ncbi:MAG TPA: LLM class F420-dependent oxidoreductase [Jatrophihabitantaceae bacterium]|nr:LLM class F420-dependent oxidoreductase [Jatrophihabitantaceae bacterium]
MDLRIFIEPQQGASYADQLRVAKAAEDLGFDAFFRSDHFLAMGGDGLPGPTDSWVTLGAIARETSRIRLGTMVTAATFRLPGPLAIAVAQVDEMSGGRVELGLGTGWFAKEHAAYGIEFPEVRERFDRFAEQLEIIHGLWTAPVGETYSFDGEHYQLRDSPALPKPAQSPRPPIILGGGGKRRSAALAARFADEYNVSFDRAATPGVFARVREAAAETGRSLIYSAAQTICLGRDGAEVRKRADAMGRDLDELRESSIAGTPAEVLDRIGEFADYGSDRLYLQVLDLADLDHLELLAAEVLGKV